MNMGHGRGCSRNYSSNSAHAKYARCARAHSHRARLYITPYALVRAAAAYNTSPFAEPHYNAAHARIATLSARCVLRTRTRTARRHACAPVAGMDRRASSRTPAPCWLSSTRAGHAPLPGTSSGPAAAVVAGMAYGVKKPVTYLRHYLSGRRARLTRMPLRETR